MPRTGSRTALTATAFGLTLLLLALLGGCATASTASTASFQWPSPPRSHLKVLAAVLAGMRRNYARYRSATPGPQDIFGYRIGELWKQGIDGTGTTIAVLEGWDDPQINRVVRAYDRQFGLPDPVIQTIVPSGHGRLPARCPPGMAKLGSYGSCDAWRGELRLDVIAAHLVAPYARILISATPADSEITDDAASQVAPPEMMQALAAISGRHLASVISISDGTGESSYARGAQEIIAQVPGELAAAAAGIPVLVATGDCGVVQNLPVASSQCANTTKTPDTAAWDDSPWVTAVGGSVPDLTASGARAGPDPVWHRGIFSAGAGYSSVFGRPAYQDAVKSMTGSAMRSVPDITMDAQAGTSEAAPLLAGVAALATQLNHGNIGPLNPVLYGVLGPRGARAGIADVISGNDSVTSASRVLVRGFSAARGFDVASGWGTIDASRFVPALVAVTRASQQERVPRQQAAAALRRMENGIQLSAADLRAGQPAYLLAGGFLPGHPVRLSIDGRVVAALTATALGSVTDIIVPSSLHLPRGAHRLVLRSMLLTEVARFRSP